MRRLGVLPLVLVALAGTACSLLTDLSGLSTGGSDGGGGQMHPPGTDGGADTGPELDGSDETDAKVDAGCACTGVVSAYRFLDANDLGHDLYDKNNMPTVRGAPRQSTRTPAGLAGRSIELDGSSTVCIDNGSTFDPTADHTLCWWSQPTALANSTNQFAQTCGYDTWTTGNGVDYLWRINNCNSGTAANLRVPNVYSVGKWAQICQTYTRATLTRTVIVNGDASQKVSATDTSPIVGSSTEPWCIGSYGGGGFWTGLIYLPIWFNRVLSDAEMQRVAAGACCLP